MSQLPLERATVATLLVVVVGCGNGKDTAESAGGIQPLSAELVRDDADAYIVSSITQYELEAEATIRRDALTGTMQWDVVQDDGTQETVLCDAELELSGTALSGYCDGCDFAFEMSGEVTEDNGNGDCVYFPQLHYTDDPFIVNPTLVFFSEYSIVYNGTRYTYTNDLRTGVAYDYTAYGPAYYYPGPYYTFVAWDNSDRGAATLTDNGDGSQTLSWDWYFTGYDIENIAYTYCSSYPENFDYTANLVEWKGGRSRSALDCTGERIDLWEVSLDAGDVFLATVDTIAADTAFDPYFYLNGPDSCTIGEADDSFPCTHPPLDYSCPTARFEVPESGTYQLAVGSYGSCTGDDAEYSLQVGRLPAGR